MTAEKAFETKLIEMYPNERARDFCAGVARDWWSAALEWARTQQGPATLHFPQALRKMWSGGEIQQWIESQGPLYAHPIPPAPNVLDRQTLRRIVDDAWNAATDSEQVPSTDWADRIIDRALAAATKPEGE